LTLLFGLSAWLIDSEFAISTCFYSFLYAVFKVLSLEKPPAL